MSTVVRPCERCVQGFVMKGEPEGRMVGSAYFHGAPPSTTTTTTTTTNNNNNNNNVTTNNDNTNNDNTNDVDATSPDTSPDTPRSDSTKAIILLTDIFGVDLVNCKLNADEISKRVGCDVWVPDIFGGMFCYLPFRVPFFSLSSLYHLHNSIQETFSSCFVLPLGRPPFKPEELDPLIPDRAGVSTSFISQLKMLGLFIMHLPALWASRPAVADFRIVEVSTLYSVIVQ